MSPRECRDYWNGLICNAFTSLDATPFDRQQFGGRLQKTTVGSLVLANVCSAPSRVEHDRAQVARMNEQVFLLHFQMQGRSLNAQNNREAPLEAGDFTLCDSSEPYWLSFDEAIEMLVLRIPHAELSKRLALPEALTGITMTGKSGVSAMLADMLRKYWWCLKQGVCDTVLLRPSDTLLDLLATSYHEVELSQGSVSTVACVNRLKIKQFITERLHDPELSPGMIARAFHMTPRNLHYLFTGEGQSVSRYIQKQRLEECRRRLADPGFRGQTITQIAFSCGFNNATHFGRVFKECYGMTPREYRRV